MLSSAVQCCPAHSLVHSGSQDSAAATATSGSDASQQQPDRVLCSHVMVHGGFSGQAVEGTLLQIDVNTLDISVVDTASSSNSSSSSKPPLERFAHCMGCLPSPSHPEQQVWTAATVYSWQFGCFSCVRLVANFISLFISKLSSLSHVGLLNLLLCCHMLDGLAVAILWALLDAVRHPSTRQLL